jgi:KDO2-lipid IV(A) lauroyltransferase
LPEGAIYPFAAFLAKLGFILNVKHRRVALESLKIAFGQEKSDSEIMEIAKLSFENMAKGMVELIFMMGHPYFFKKSIKIVGKEHLEKAFQEGKGVIGVSAHFGNFPAMLVRFVQEGYKASAIMRFARDEKFEKFFLQKRNEFGVKTVYSQPRKACVEESIRVLRNNELLFIPLDQNFGTAGVFVDFFGTKAATATGPVVFAMRTKAPILPMFIVRQKDDTHKIIVEPPLYIEEKEDYKETLIYNVSRITKIIESYIRKYPQEWGWIHRRWKSRPVGK